MRRKFLGYYRPTEKEFSELWKSCLFAFDANVLLNLYRYTAETKTSLLAILEKVSDRIWLPYQAAYEYHNRRLDVIQQLTNAYDKILEIVRNSRTSLEGNLSSIGRHPSIQTHELLKSHSDALEKFEDTLAKLKQEHPDFLTDDPIKETISTLFDGKVGEPTEEGELLKVYKQGEERYKSGRPPGYADRGKGGTEQYSDLVIWFQLIAKARESKKPIIFVTDDRKGDWWLKSGGKTIGPRPELVQEFSEKSNIAFYMYSADPFMEYARKHLKQKVEKKAIDEVREVRKRDEKSASQTINLRDIAKSYGDQLAAIKLSVMNNPAYDSARKMAADFERLKHSAVNSAAYDMAQKIAEIERANLSVMHDPVYNTVRKIAEEYEMLKDSCMSSTAYDMAQKMAEIERANLSIMHDSTYDMARKMAEEYGRAERSIMSSTAYDTAQKMAEIEKARLTLANATIHDSNDDMDDSEEKKKDMPGSDTKMKTDKDEP